MDPEGAKRLRPAEDPAGINLVNLRGAPGQPPGPPAVRTYYLITPLRTDHLVSATPMKRKAEAISPEVGVDQTPELEWDRQIQLTAAGEAPPGMMSAAQLKAKHEAKQVSTCLRRVACPQHLAHKVHSMGLAAFTI